MSIDDIKDILEEFKNRDKEQDNIDLVIDINELLEYLQGALHTMISMNAEIEDSEKQNEKTYALLEAANNEIFRLNKIEA